MSKKLTSELFFVLLLAMALSLSLALFSFDARDPGFAYVGHDQQVRNWLGPFGAWLASFMLFALGWAAYFFPAFMLHAAWVSLRQAEVQIQPVGHFILPLLGWLLTLVAICGLASLHFASSLTFTAGGTLGMFVIEWLYPGLAMAGTTLVLLTAFVLGTSLAYHLSWLTIADRAGDLCCRLVLGLWTFLTRPSANSERKVAPKFAAPLPSQATAKASPSWLAKLKLWQGGKAKAKVSSPVKKEPRLTAVPVDLDDALLVPRPSTSMSTPTPPSSLPPSQTAKATGKAASTPRQLRIENLRSEQQPSDDFDQPEVPLANLSVIPSTELLSPVGVQEDSGYSEEQLEQMADNLQARLADFGVKVAIDAVCPGPVITRFEVQPAPGVKASRISGLARDLARSMAMVSVRVVEVIPGKRTVGIEVPNAKRAIVSFREVLESEAFIKSKSPLTLALGHDIAGEAVVADLGKMPHLLVAGTTGSGKSVGVNAMLMSMLFKATPEQLRLMLIDPKMLELSVYDGIPHLLTPVITDMKDAAQGLRWCVAEMERRYKLMSKLGVRNIAGYNQKVHQAAQAGQPLLDPLWDPQTSLDPNRPPPLETLPMIVVVVDEFADMMMIVGKKVEELIARIAQKARAAGIHLILATQRPSVDVITGLIKANVPTRMAFQVSSKIDSRTILDQGGAEQLLGHGDMLFMPPGKSLPLRVHGAFVPDEDVHKLVDAWKERGEPQYLESIFQDKLDDSGMLTGLVDSEGSGGEGDPLYDQAVQIVIESRKGSISYVQRQLRIGYNRAANLIQSMEDAGVVSPAGHNGSREVLAPPSQ